MKSQKIILIARFLFTLLLITGYGQKVFACRCGNPNHTPSPTGHTVPLPVMVPPMPEFEHRWQTKDVIESFEEKGLAVEKQRSIFDEGSYNSAIEEAEEAVRFDLASYGKDIGVCIHTFTSKDDLKHLQEYFLGLNEKGDLYTWSFVKDNVLLVLTGTIPEEVARQYEIGLYSLNK